MRPVHPGRRNQKRTQLAQGPRNTKAASLATCTLRLFVPSATEELDIIASAEFEQQNNDDDGNNNGTAVQRRQGCQGVTSMRVAAAAFLAASFAFSAATSLLAALPLLAACSRGQGD